MPSISIREDQVAGMIVARAKATLKAIQRGAIRGSHRAKVPLVAKAPTDLGQLRNSIHVKPGAPIGASGFGELARIDIDAPHAGIVELGARPHKVSAEGWAAIYQWVYRHRKALGFVTKSGNARRMAPTRGDVRTKTDVNPELAAVTWAIVKKIEKFGQKPTFFVRDFTPTAQAIAIAEIQREIAKIANRKVPGEGK